MGVDKFYLYHNFKHSGVPNTTHVLCYNVSMLIPALDLFFEGGNALFQKAMLVRKAQGVIYRKSWFGWWVQHSLKRDYQFVQDIFLYCGNPYIASLLIDAVSSSYQQL